MSTTSSTPDPAAPQPISPPPDFPVVWETPAEAAQTWNWESIHNSEPVPPLDELFWHAIGGGCTVAGRSYGSSAQWHYRLINHYVYVTVVAAPLSPEEHTLQLEKIQEAIEAAIPPMADRWQTQWLPEIKHHMAFWDEFGLDTATMPALLAHLAESIERLNRLWEIHFLIIDPGYMALSLFDELYHELFGDTDAFAPYKLLQGFDNKTLAMGHALWDLSQQAQTMPEVHAIFATHTIDDILTTLTNTAAAQPFVANLQRYLAEFGQRGDHWGLSYPAWLEDPRPVLKNLQNYLARPDDDPRAELAALATEREQAIAAARAQLHGYPQPVVDRFEAMLKAAQVGLVLSEDHGYWIDFQASYKVRRVLLAIGRRFVDAGLIERPADIFFLTLDEVRQSGENGATPKKQQSLIAERQADLDHFRRITPPRTLGMAVPEPPADSFLARMNARFNGAPPAATSDPTLIVGHPGAPGKIRGRAKVIRIPAEATKLQPGDILVTESTAPPWTPLFGTIGAVVTNTGGILSHCAVVAREYHIPAVVGTQTATTAIQDGQYLEVDGDAGLVRILSAHD